MENVIAIIGKRNFTAITNNINAIGKNKLEETESWLSIGVLLNDFKGKYKQYKIDNPTKQIGAMWEVIEQAFNLKKSWGCKVIKASQLGADVIEGYFESRRSNTALTCGIDDLLRFAQGGESTEGEGEGEGEGEATDKQKPIVTFTCRLQDLEMGSNVSLRINADGSVVTSASADDIAKAIAILQSALQPVVA